jgi:FtsP/CotA-like multicopper oxidase with cupredoxin domain
LSGAVIVDGLAAYAPQIANLEEHVLLARDTPSARATALTINGTPQPALRIAPGERQFWRMVNAGGHTTLNIAVDHTTMQMVAADGVPLVDSAGRLKTITVSNWKLAPGARAEFIVTGPQTKAAYLRTTGVDAGALASRTLASIDPRAPSTAEERAPGRGPARRSASRTSGESGTGPGRSGGHRLA